MDFLLPKRFEQSVPDARKAADALYKESPLFPILPLGFLALSASTVLCFTFYYFLLSIRHVFHLSFPLLTNPRGSLNFACIVETYLEEEDEWSRNLLALEGKAKQATNEKDWVDVQILLDSTLIPLQESKPTLTLNMNHT